MDHRQEDDCYKQKVLEFRQVFDMFDTNKDGALSADELKEVLAKMGKAVSHTDAYAIIASLDDNSNGKLEFCEFLNLVLGANHHRTALVHAFQAYDKDEDGFITIEEIGEALQILGHADIMDARLFDVIDRVDMDGNGMIDFKEFSAMLTSR